ncbi:uncharacterized protein LOC133789692 [Humulus lupulus]|uniref:uncharacterized protein LOC133789692 n=1 Tax=Humulus lupulus TaxID=3486 RepID=UPI002B40F90F|nr:uncharacterized protein LOC133789692 [Humulus lupulus]
MDRDMASHSCGPQAMLGCFVVPFYEEYDTLPHAFINLGPSGPHFSGVPAPPPPSVSGSSILAQPGAPDSEGKPWVGHMAASYGKRYTRVTEGIPKTEWRGCLGRLLCAPQLGLLWWLNTSPTQHRTSLFLTLKGTV